MGSLVAEGDESIEKGLFKKKEKNSLRNRQGATERGGQQAKTWLSWDDGTMRRTGANYHLI